MGMNKKSRPSCYWPKTKPALISSGHKTNIRFAVIVDRSIEQINHLQDIFGHKFRLEKAISQTGFNIRFWCHELVTVIFSFLDHYGIHPKPIS